MYSPTLLFVDDRSQLLQFRKAALESLGYSVQTATSTTGAIELLQQKPVNAVLLEYKREGMDAEAVALHIRQRFPQQAIILVSAYSDMPERILWLVDEYVMKSAPLECLAQVIDRVAGKPRSAPQGAPKRAASAA